MTWEWLGEGTNSDYNEDDPDDIPLLRFSCYKCGHLTGELWKEIPDGSYCTDMPIDTPFPILVRTLVVLLEVLKNTDYSKNDLRKLSWLCPSDVEYE